MALTYQYTARTAPQILTRARTTAVPVDPITGLAAFDESLGPMVVYQIFVFNNKNITRYFTFYNSSVALDQGEAIIFPWAVDRGSNLQIDFPQGLYLDEGFWGCLSTDPDVLAVDPNDEMRIILVVRSDLASDLAKGPPLP